MKTIVLAVLLASFVSLSGIARASSAPSALLDTLGTATPATTFSVWGAGGAGVGYDGTRVGPEFVLTQPMLITEVGGFVNNCKEFVSGLPQCPDTSPLLVQIVPRSRAGLPDMTSVLGTFTLSHDNNPLLFSYESTEPNLVLAPGAYFALFVAQNDDRGAVLASAGDYVAGLATIGWWRMTDGVSNVETYPMAVRILGKGVAELFGELATATGGVGPGTSLADKLADAQAAQESRDFPEACQILGSFTSEVQAQAGKKIPQQTADQLFDAAARIRAMLGC